MNVEILLSQLRKVRRTAPGEWVACCPSHEDRTPSLAIKDCGDGRLLLHCYAACPVEDVVGAVGLTLADLMPEQAIDHSVHRVPFNPRTILEAIAFQATVVAIAATDLSNGQTLSLDDKDRLWQASESIHEAVSHATR